MTLRIDPDTGRQVEVIDTDYSQVEFKILANAITPAWCGKITIAADPEAEHPVLDSWFSEKTLEFKSTYHPEALMAAFGPSFFQMGQAFQQFQMQTQNAVIGHESLKHLLAQSHLPPVYPRAGDFLLYEWDEVLHPEKVTPVEVKRHGVHNVTCPRHGPMKGGTCRRCRS